MKISSWIVLLVCVFAGLAAAQDRQFGWVRANAEYVQLDPADAHSGRVYRPSAEGGNIHVGIEATRPLTVAMAWADDWNYAQQHPEAMANVEFRCLREHVTSTVYECHLPGGRPMVLLTRDERTSNHALIRGIDAVIGHGGTHGFISPNEVHIQYYSWSCVENCLEAEYQWFRLVKEKYEVTPAAKVYSLLTPERDGQQVNIRIKAPLPMTVAMLPVRLADQVYGDPQSLNTALAQTTCKQRGVQTLTFDCTFNKADGPQSLVIVPDIAVRNRKKAEIEFQAVKCARNCWLMAQENDAQK